MADLAQLVPESTGSALARAVTGRGLILGRPAAAQGGNAIVVTAATAARYRPGTISSFGTSVADRILDRLTEPPRGKPGTSTAFPQLTGREIEILDLLARALSNHAISARLYLSDKTVRNHVSQLLRKLGFQRRSQAAAWAGQRRLELPPA